MAVSYPVMNYDELVREDRVHGSVYTSQEIFEDEVEKVFHRTWMYVAHASEVEGLRRAGYDIPCEPIWRYRGTPSENISLYVLDPDGTLFELVSRLPRAAYRTPSSRPKSQ